MSKEVFRNGTGVGGRYVKLVLEKCMCNRCEREAYVIGAEERHAQLMLARGMYS